ncbi:MAG: hypothetical protein DHS20C15_32620 [Planctomycetota bacterium]|nr:MAG: hypothetical protein DHS20C15_32620 [Planctomycetota bacterium]
MSEAEARETANADESHPARSAASARGAAVEHHAGPRLGLIVPCRNEARVIGRKLRNLALARWPSCARPHRLLILDDHSADDTAERARALCEQLFAARASEIHAEVLVNAHDPGKVGALNTALETLGDDVDLVVLTDADVLIDEHALTELSDFLAQRPALGMACARQQFAETLGEDGRALAPGRLALTDAAGTYDRLTAAVRAWESRGGRLFSVHGQLLAWRASLGLRPTPGIAADDLELMLGVRAAGLGVALAPGAVFVEEKPPAGAGRRTQEIRRARAYVQIAPRFRASPGSGLLTRLQFAAYRYLPLNAPWLLPVVALLGPSLLIFGLRSFTGLVIGNLLALAVIVFLWSPAGRKAVRLLTIISTARRMQAMGELSDRWEMPRP